MIIGLHHVQLAMPAGGEDVARGFYAGVLGFQEIAKPSVLQSRGGVWFALGDIYLHLGVEDPFVPARKAHPAFRVAALKHAVSVFAKHGVAVRKDTDFPGIQRVYVEDPFGNRIEILEVTGG